MQSTPQPIQPLGMLWLALLGALVATFCDAMHVQTGTLVYPNPVLFGQAWWPFLGFTLAFLWMSIVYRLLDRFLPPSIVRSFSTTSGSSAELAETLLLFAFVYLLSGFGNASPIFLSLLFYGAFVIRLAQARERVFLAVLSVLLALGGTFSEALLSALGMVSYTRFDFLGVPAWLPGLYLHGAFALRDGYRRLVTVVP